MAHTARDIGRIVWQLRNRVGMTRVRLAALAGVSPSHLSRVESGQRSPSARVLRKIAPHVGIGEMELLAYAGYVPPVQFNSTDDYAQGRLDPHVVASLSQEPVELQRAVLSIFSALKVMAEGIASQESRVGSDDDHIHDGSH